MALLLGVASCVPSFPDEAPTPGEDAGRPVDVGQQIDDGGGSGGRDGSRGCGPHASCSPPEVCRRGACTSECDDDDDCATFATACLRGHCLAPCAGHAECEAGEACQAGFGCIPYCESNSGCPDPLVCRALNSRAKLCVCVRDMDCSDRNICVEGQCVPRCSTTGDHACTTSPGRRCVDAWGRCMPEDCAETADPVCGTNVAEFCLVADTSGLGGGEAGFCTQSCNTTDRGDGDTCGVGFRCEAYDIWTFCLPVGNLTAGDSCVQEGLSVECTTSFCFWETCTVLCTGLLDRAPCTTLFGDAGICRRTDVSLGDDRLWACDPVVH